MKLHLPHKFQAALIAALASVSFTTLSTGSSAQAWTLDDAALKMYDFTQASVDGASADGWTFTNTVANTDGVFTTTSSTTDTAIKHPENWAGLIGSNRVPWAGVITINVNDLPDNIDSGVILNCSNADGTSNGMGVGYTMSSGTVNYTGFNNLARWNDSRNQDITNLAQYADANGLVTVGVFYTATGGMNKYVENQFKTSEGLRSTTTTQNPAMRLSNVAGVEYTNLYVFAPDSATAISQADMQGLMQAAGAYYWTGSSSATWDAATTNWTHYGSSVAVAIGTNGGNAHTNVVFGADATQKTVTLAGATTVGALTVSGGDYTFNLNGNLTTSGITIAQGASLARTGSGSITGTLAGAGTFILPTNSTTLGVTLGNDWTGTVRLVNVSGFGGGNLATFANGTLSTVELNGINGYTSQWNNGHYDFDIRLTDYGNTAAWNFSDGSGSGTQALTLNGSISGHGTLQKTKDNNQGFVFTGNISEWDGMYKHDNTAISTLTFKGNATVVNATINKANANGTINVNVGDGTNTFSTTFNKAVTATKLAVNNKASATLKESLALTGDLTLDGSATLEKGGSVGTIDLSHGGNAHGTLTLNAGQTLTYSSSFWGANNNKLLLGEGATVKQASNAPIEIVGQAGESYVSSSSNTQFGLTASAYTLHNVQATIKSASDNVQLRFDNSKLVTSQNITLKNLQSVFSGMDIRGGTTTVGAADAAAATVALGAVTLSNGGNLALADLVTGNVSSIDVTGTSAISGGTLSMGGTITTQADARLTLGGTVLFANGGIATSGSGTLAFDDGVVFDLRQLTEDTATHTYTLFTGDSTVDLTRFTDTANDHITGVITTGRKWTFNDNGTVSYQILSRDLVWRWQEAATWSTEQTDTSWTLNGDVTPTYFAGGDAVTFKNYGTATTATLGSDVTAASMTVEAGAVVTVNNGAETTYAFSADELDVAGTLTTNTDIAVKQVNISEGGVWNMGGDLTPASLDSYENAGTIKLLSGATMTAAATDTNLGMVTAEEGGTLIVSGSGAYTFAGPASDPFSGRLIYNLASSTGHDGSISLSNFDGTLEIRGRLNASASNFGGMTKLVLNGDRGGNTTTGLWNTAALTLNVPVDIVGENQVDLYASANMIINGDINAGGAAGILGKRDGKGLYLNGNVNLLGLSIYASTVTLNGGAEKAYNLGAVTFEGGSLAIGENGVKSLTATDLVVKSTGTLSSAAAAPTAFNVTRLDVSNWNTNFTLQNVTLNVSGAATAAVLNTAQANDQATVTVGDKATLNLNGGVVWNKADGAKTDYVNLTVNNGGAANITAGSANVLNAVTVNAGGKLAFSQDTATTVKGTLTLNDTLTNAGTLVLDNGGSVASGNTGVLAGSGTTTLNGTIGGAGTFKLDSATLIGGTDASITANMVIDGGTLGGAMALGASGTTIRVTDVFTVADDVNLHILGNIVLDDLASSSATYTGAEFGGDNGFLSGVSVKVFESNVLEPGVVIEGAITYKGASGFMYAGVFSTNNPNYVTFIVNEMMDDHVETYSHAKSVGGDSFTNVELAAGTSFNVDSENAALTGVVVRDGETAASLAIGSTASIGSVTTGAGLTLTGSGTLTLGSAAADASLNGAGTLTINGPSVTITGTNNGTFTGNVDVVSGTLKLGDSTGNYVLGAHNYAAGDTRTITVHTGATLDINGKVDNNYVYTLAGGRLTNSGNAIGNGSSQTVGLVLTADSYVGGANEFWLRQRSGQGRTKIELGTHNLTKDGSGKFGLYDTDVTGTGSLVVQEGTLDMQGVSLGANLRMSGGNVTGGTVTLAKDITIDAATAGTISAVIAGSDRTITKEGNGELTLSGSSSFSGSVLVNAGTVILGNGNALGAQNNAVTIESGATVDINGKDNRIYSYTLNGGSLVNNGGATSHDHTQNASIELTDNSTVGGSDKMWMIASGWGTTTANLGGHTLTKEGTGTFSFVNTGISAGTIAVKQGTVEFYNQSADKISRVQADIELDGGTISGVYKYTDSAEAVTRNLTVTQSAVTNAAITIGNNVTLAANVAANQVLTLGGAITGTGNFSLSGPGTLKLAGSDMISANTLTFNSGSTLDVSNIAQMAGITVNLASYTDSASYSDLNITGLNSGLTYSLTDDGSHVAITFASQQVTPPTPTSPNLGKVMYVGDSITDGVTSGSDHAKSWRYSFFQVLADGGIDQTEQGYYQHHQSSGAIPEGTIATYGGRDFQNIHSAQASARSAETAGDTTLASKYNRYGYSSIQNWLGQRDTMRNGADYPEGKPVYKDETAPETYFMLLGTNDLLSEGGDHVSDAHFSNVLDNMFGYNGSTFDGETGTFDIIWKSMTTARKDSQLIVLEMPTWSPDHTNHQYAADFAYMTKFNQKLHEWAASKANKDQITIVNPNLGIVDVANTTKPGAGVASMFLSDHLHPSAQGELLIAGNVAKQLGYAGRTVGLDRASYAPGSTTWNAAGETTITVTDGAEAQTFAENAFNTTDGYTIDFGVLYGDGFSGGWSDKANALTVQVGDGYNIGTLTFSEAYVMWGNTVLYSRDNSQEGDNFRIAYVNQSVKEADHVSTGYYVWMGDQLIGEALSGVSGSFNGISLTSTGANGTVKNLTWSDTAYAPTTTLYKNEDTTKLFHLEQANTLPTHTDTPQGIKDDIEWQTTTDKFALPSGQSSTAKTIYKEFSSNIGANYTGAANADYEGDIGMHYKGTADMDARQSVLSVYNATVTGNVYVQFDNPNTVYNSFTNTNKLSVTAGYNGNITGSYTAVYNAGIFNYDVRGGEHTNANATIGGGSYSYVNGGTFKANVMGGGVTGTIDGGTHVTVSGGEIAGSVYGGGIGGTINDGTYVTITGGVIAGNVIGGGTGGTITGGTHVTVEGILPSIKGNISADNVTLKDVVNPQEYVDGFDSYAGTITATTLTLDNYKAGEMLATVTATNLALTNGTATTINNLTTAAGTAISVDATSSLTLGQANLSAAIANAGTLVLTQDITASGLEQAGEDVSYRVGVNDAKATDANYFYQGQRTESTLRVVSGEGNLQVADGLTVTQGGVDYAMAANGTATGVTAEADYSTFYQGQAGTTVSVAQVAATAALHDTELLAVYSLGAYENPTVLNVDQNLANALVAFSTVNIASGVEYTGNLLVFGGMNTVSGQIETARLGFYGGNASVTTFTEAPVVNAGVRFSSDAVAGGVQVHANQRSAGDENYYEYSIGDSKYAVVASELSKEGEGDANVANSLMVQRVHNSEASSTGKLTLSAGAVNMSLQEVVATSGDIEFLNMAAASATQEGKQTSVSLNKLEIGAGKTVSFYEATAPATPEELAKEAVVTVKNTLTAGTGATLNSDLVMESGSVLNVSEAQGSNGLTMGSSVFLKNGNLLGENDLTLLGGLGYGEYYYLFNDVEDLYINGEHVDKLDFQDWQHFDLDASQVYANLDPQTYALVYNWTPVNGSNVGTIAITFIPEPTTGTLSLLALAALAARRRRK